MYVFNEKCWGLFSQSGSIWVWVQGEARDLGYTFVLFFVFSRKHFHYVSLRFVCT